MADFDDRTIEKNQQRMETARTGFDSLRREVAALALPTQQAFDFTRSMQGADLMMMQYDEYAAQALEDGVAAFEGFVIPRGQRWQGLVLADETLMKRLHVRQWLEAVTKRLFALRNDQQSGFSHNVHQSGTSLFAFGEQSMWVDIRYDPRGFPAGLSYQSEHVDGIFVERDAEGRPYRQHRKFKLTAEQASLKWPDDAPPKVREKMEGLNQQPDSEMTFIHVIEPNPDMKPGRIDAAGMPYRAAYYSCEDRMVFRKGGHWTMPRIVSCFDRMGKEDYGRSRAMLVLPAIRACQVLMQDRVLATELNVKRPLKTIDDELDMGIIDIAPWGITYGGMDERGNDRIKELLGPIDVQSAEALHAELRRIIDKAFYRDLLQINREMKTHISAVRTLEEISEKGILMDPLARQENEWFSAMLPRELQLMEDLGLLDDMPADVARYMQAGGPIDARYDNNLTRMQSANEALGFMRTAEQVGLLAQFDPSVVGQFQRTYPMGRVIPQLGYINGVPASWEASDDEKEAAEQAAQQADQLQQLLAAAPVISKSIKDVSQAGGGGV